MWSLETDLPVKLAIIFMNGVKVDSGPAAYGQINQLAQSYYAKYLDTPISQVPGVQHARSFFRAIGIDPTKRRPSSEALLNRAVKNKGLYSVNSLVDVGNWCSLDFLLPICVYDADKISGQVSIRTGREGEFYIGLNNNEVHLHDRYCIADELGPFGSPKTDSQRTAVSTGTRNTVLIIFAPGDYDPKRLRQQAGTFAKRVLDICGGAVDKTDLMG